MATVADICRYMEDLAPLKLAEPWDNVGLLLGRTDQNVRRVMTCLTLTMPVAEEARQLNTQLIITHHPVLFRGTKKLTDKTSEGRLLLLLAEAKIAVYSPHTAFDSAGTGINQELASSLGLDDIQPLKKANDDIPGGQGRIGQLSLPCDFETFLARTCHAVQARYLEFACNAARPIQKVAVACGSAGEFLDDAIAMGCDTFVTGETRFHTVLECQAKAINLILLGHFCSERPAVENLAARMAPHFPTVECLVSQNDKNPLSLYRPGLD